MKPSELLSSPEKWTKGVYAKDSNGVHVLPASREAVRFCLRGALKRCGVYDIETQMKLTLAIKEVGNYAGITVFNDHPETTFADIQAVLKEAGL